MQRWKRSECGPGLRTGGVGCGVFELSWPSDGDGWSRRLRVEF